MAVLLWTFSNHSRVQNFKEQRDHVCPSFHAVHIFLLIDNSLVAMPVFCRQKFDRW